MSVPTISLGNLTRPDGVPLLEEPINFVFEAGESVRELSIV